MNKIDIYINYSPKDLNNIFDMSKSNHTVKIDINIFNLSNYELVKTFEKIKSVLKIFDSKQNQIKRINIIMDKKIDQELANRVLTKLNDILYNFYPITREVKLYQVTEESNNLMNELNIYKNEVMNPNKTPKTYLEWVKSQINPNYGIKIFNTSESEAFPFTRAVGLGSNHDSYFVHVYPKNVNKKNKNLFLVGKAVTYDSGGLNLKRELIEEMKVDMTGSAIIVSVLKLLSMAKLDSEYSIHLLIPIVENMIGSKALKPGMVVKSARGKLVEIINTDAEGRLCMVDCLDYIHMNLLTGLDPANCLIIDIATLTGNTLHITSGISSICMCNNKGLNYTDDLINLGENIGEYLDFLKIRSEYLSMLKSPMADIKNLDMGIKAGCVIAGTFLNYFVDEKIPYIHIDLGVSTFVNSVVNSYGINLLYEFIKRLNNIKN